MSKMSERQLGAYLFAHLGEFSFPPETLRDFDVNLRNKVTHQGYIPTEIEAIGYGNKVQDCILAVINRINRSEKHARALVGAINHYLPIVKDAPQTTLFPWHILPTNRPPDDRRKSVEDHVNAVRNRSQPDK